MFPSKRHSQHRRSQTLQPLHPPVNTHIYKHTPARARPSGRELQQANLWDPREGKGQGTQTGLTSLPPSRVSKLGTSCMYYTYTSNFFQTWWTQQPLEPHGLLTLGPPLWNIKHFENQKVLLRGENGAFAKHVALRLTSELLTSSSEKSLSSVTWVQAGVQ